MRLICGIIRFDGSPVEPNIPGDMVRALSSPGYSHRIACRVEGSAALAVLDFAEEVTAIISTSDQRQDRLPCGPDGTWLAGDLRLDRPVELARALSMPADTDDQQLTLAALERWGSDLPDMLHGDFAMAAWHPGQRRLVCARDIMGVRPLCYTHAPGRLFAFASFPRGLHASGIVSPRLDPIALGRVLVDSYYREESTGFDDIRWLPAGHTAAVTRDGIRLHNAWRPNQGRVGEWRGSAQAAADDLRALAQDAVACRVPVSGPLASHLSGGLDSSSITVLSARQLRNRSGTLYSYSKLARPVATERPEDIPVDERQYVEAVLAQEQGIRWTPIHQPALDDDGVFEPDFGLAGPFADPDERICELAAREGCRLLLSGAGGDEGATYNGGAILPALLRAGRLGNLCTELSARARRDRAPILITTLRQLIFPMTAAWLTPFRPHSGSSRSGDRQRNALSFLRPSLAAQVEASIPPAFAFGSGPEARVAWMAANHLADRGTRWSILGARHALAFSYPLADRRIIEFGLSLPVERLVDRGLSRQPFRNAMAGILPEKIRWRSTKFVAFPDLEGNLRLAMPGLLAKVEAFRGSEAAESMFDLKAISTAFRSAAESPVGPVVLRSNGQPEVSRPMRIALHALRAFTLARYVARMTGQ